MRIVILCSTDIIWAQPAWQRAIPKLIEEGHEVSGLLEVTGKPKYLRKHSYLRTFGLMGAMNLGLYAAIVVAKRFLKHEPMTLKAMSRQFGVQHYSVSSPNSHQAQYLLSSTEPDLVVAMTAFIIKPHVLSIPKIGFLNKHASLLPAFRGVLPYFWGIIKGAPQGVTYHLMDESIDEGAVIYQRRISGKASLVAFYRNVFDHFDEDLSAALQRLEKGEIIDVNGEEGSYYSFPARADYRDFIRAGGSLVNAEDFLRLFHNNDET